MSNNIMDWKLKMLNPIDYELNLVFQTNHKLIINVFQKARAALMRKKQIAVAGNPDLIGRFDVPKEYLYTIKTAVAPLVAKIRKEQKEKVELMSWDIDKAEFVRTGDQWNINVHMAEFVRTGDQWNINVHITGTWVDKR